MSRIEPEEGFEVLKERVSDAVKSIFPIQGNKNSIRIDSVSVKDDKAIDDYRSQKEARLNGKTWSVPVNATLSLIDNKTGNVINSSTQRLFNLPKITSRHSYIIDGQEYQIDNQWRLKYGVYSRVNDRGDIESTFHTKGSEGFKLKFDPQSSQFVITKRGTTGVPAYPILKEMGVSDEEMKKSWGESVFNANKVDDGDKTLIRFYKSINKSVPGSRDELKAGIEKFIGSGTMDPGVNKITLGKNQDKIDGSLMFGAANKLLGISRGEVKPDTRDSLIFKSFHSAEDFIAEALTARSKDILKKIKNGIDRKADVKEIVGPGVFNKPITHTFIKTSLANRTDQINPLEMISGAMKTTVMGEGGIQDAEKVTDEAKLVDESHLGFLDPIHTPEGCFDDQTEVFTKCGWKFWKDVTNADLLACRIDDHLEFHSPVKLIVARYMGKMCGVDTSKDRRGAKWKVEYLVTPNHRIYSRSNDDRDQESQWKIELADSMHGKTRILQLSHKPWPGKECNSHQPPFAEEYIEEVFDRPVDVREHFLECLIHGTDQREARRIDASICLRDIYTTADPKLAANVERLAVGLGYTVSVVKRYENYEESHCQEVYEVWILSQKEWMISGWADHFYTVNYDGMIYCAEVPGGLLYVRRNGGLAHWSGNSKTGITLHLPIGVEKKNNTIASRLYNLKTKKLEDVDPETAYNSKVILPDQVKWVNGTPVPRNKSVKMSAQENEIVEGNLKDADYIIPSPVQLFSAASNMIPFLQANSGNRATYAGKQMEQAVPLKYREEPLVQTVIRKNDPNTSMNEFLGRINSQRSPIDGEVVDIKNDAIHIKGNDGKIKEVQIYDNYPLNHDKGFLHSAPLVKVGDKIKAYQAIADTNFTKNGRLALGTHLKTAYIPFKGYNFEDGVVISESAAKKLISEHMSKKALNLTTEHIQNKDKFIAYERANITKDQSDKLDKDGVVQVGQKVLPGDILIAALRKREETDEARIKAKMHKSLVRPYDNVSVKWESDHPGVVTNIVKKGKFTEVHVKTEEPAEVGDKLCGRFGNKGIITKVLPDEEMPKTREGEHIEIALNPSGIPGRLNLGQVLETAAAKIAKKEGKPYYVQNFDGTEDITEKVKGDLQKAGLTDKEELIDPKTGEVMGKALVGPHYIHKLVHQVEKKRSSRAGGPGYVYDMNKIPKGGGHQGAKSMDALGMYAMLAHGANCFLAGTTIRTPFGGYVEISDVVKNRRRVDVYSWNVSENRMQVKPIVAWSCRVADPKELIKLTVVANDLSGKKHLCKIKVTSGHEFYTPSGKVQVGDLKEGDKLFTPTEEGLDRSTIIAISSYVPEHYEDYLVYNVEVEDNHNYFADGVLVGNSNIREMATYKSDATNNDTLWTAIQAGDPIPAPRPSFAYNKFIDLLKVAGVNTVKEGNSLNLVPITDKHILEMSNGEIKDAGRIITAKNMREEKGGLFDKEATGGLNGNKWAHISLPEKMPNPIFEKAILSLTGLKGAEFEDLMYGRKALDPKTGKLTSASEGVSGGPAMEHLLGKINVGSELKTVMDKLNDPKLSGEKLDKLNKKVKYLQVLQKLNLNPTEAYMVKNVPVLPPSMRPISAMQDGTLIQDDMNGVYKGLGLAVNKFKDIDHTVYPVEDVNKRRGVIYDAMCSVSGLGGHLNREHRGVLDIIAGKSAINEKGVQSGSPRDSYFQSKLIKRKQDLTMRSTIVPEPELSLDQVGLPREAAMEVYKPFVVKEIRGLTGASPLKAKQMVEQGDPVAQRALERVAENRPVLMKRDPVLHKYGVQAFKPVLVSGKAIKIHPLVVSGFNADFDGDQQINSVLVTVPRNLYAKNINFWSMRKIELGTQFKNKVGYVYDDGEFAICRLEDFPRESLLKTKDHIQFWSVPSGIKVVAMDENTGKPLLAEVSGWSFHKQRKVEIVELGSGRQIVTDDDKRAVYGIDASSLEWCRKSPSEARWQFVPVLDQIPRPEVKIKSIPLPASECTKEEAQLDGRFGYFLGSIIGGRWIDRYYGGVSKAIYFSTTCGSVYDSFVESLLSVYKDVPPSLFRKNAGPSQFVSPVEYETCVISDESVVELIGDLVGRKEESKHLPPFFASAPISFTKGLLAGLLDTESGFISWTSTEKNQDFVCAYSSKSLRLIQEIQHLLRLLGVSSTITHVKIESGEYSWILEVSIFGFYTLGGLPIKSGRKANVQDEFLKGICPCSLTPYSRFKVVPIPAVLAKHLLGKAKLTFHRILSNAIERQCISKKSAKRIVESIGDEGCDHPLYARWKSLVLMEGVHFESVVAVEKTNIEEDGYDLTVPGFETFMSMDGIVLSNTMSAFVPITGEAVDEAYRMFPSRNLFSPATGKLMYRPTLESQLGIYLMTKSGKETNKTFKDANEAAAAVKSGKAHITDVVSIGGVKTSLGRYLVAGALPKSIRNDVLSGKTKLDGKGQNELLTRVAKEHVGDFGNVADKLKNFGNSYATDTAFSLGLDDLKSDKKVRDKILAEADKKVAESISKIKDPTKAKKEMVKIYDQASEKMINVIEEKHKDSPTNLFEMMKAGVKPDMTAYRQITMAPMLVMNAKGEVLPTPIRKSWSEGLDTADYWTQMSGARKGVIQKVQSVRDPGYFTKQLVNTTISNSIATDDCRTSKGISLDIEERDVLDRYLATDVKAGNKVFKAGTLITAGVRDSLRNNKVTKVVVRSPLRCEHGTGTCSKCYGLDENGVDAPRGKNIGVISAQAIGERATQLSMKTFHSGGMAPVGAKEKQKAILTDQFKRVQQLTQMWEKVPGSATLSQTTGMVDDVQRDPAGGYNVIVGGVRNYVPQDRGEPMTMVGDKMVPIKKGMKIQKGSPVCNGPINPHEMLPLTGINKVQSYISGALYEFYKDEGIRRRNIETAVKSMTNLTKINDAGDDSAYLRGDFAPLSQVQAKNKELVKNGKKPIEHSPVLKGVKTMPLDIQTDWMARLNHEQLKGTVIEAANQGWGSDLHGPNPIPGMAYGAEFGIKNKKI